MAVSRRRAMKTSTLTITITACSVSKKPGAVQWLPMGNRAAVDRLDSLGHAPSATGTPPIVDADDGSQPVPSEPGSKVVARLTPYADRVAELLERDGSPGWSRTSDFLINRRGSAPSRPSVFL